MSKIRKDHLGRQCEKVKTDQLSKTFESAAEFALMSDEEWEAETIARYKRIREKNGNSKR